MILTGIMIAAAAGSAIAGAGSSFQAWNNHQKTGQLASKAAALQEYGTQTLELQRERCTAALDQLGLLKAEILSTTIARFVASFGQIKNIDFRTTPGILEIPGLVIDKTSFQELQNISIQVKNILESAGAGAAAGGLTAFGAWGAAGALAYASTGTAISTLSGAAATNATLAFFGGGSLAAGGLGMAGGAAVLGGLVAGPALLVFGKIMEHQVGANLENAKADLAAAQQHLEEYINGAIQCNAIRKKSWLFYALLTRLDSVLAQNVLLLERVLINEGTNYANFSDYGKTICAKAATAAFTLKKVLDTPILLESGEINPGTSQIEQKVENFLTA